MLNKVLIDDDGRNIELTYGVSGDGTIRGTAYFFRDDMSAEIVNGEFVHPSNGNEYRMHVPYREGQDVILEVRTYRTIGRALPEILAGQ